jgi:hypothetical protein
MEVELEASIDFSRLEYVFVIDSTVLSDDNVPVLPGGSDG